MPTYNSMAELQSTRAAQRGGHKARVAGVNARRDAKGDEKAKIIRALREATYTFTALEGSIASAESVVTALRARQARLEADVARMRQEGAEKGVVHSDLAASLLTLAEFPAMIVAAQSKVPGVRASYEDAEVRLQQAQAAFDAFMSVPEPEPVLTKRKGR